MQWTKEKTKKVIELKNSGLTWAGIAEEMSARYDERYTVDSCRGRYRNHRHTVSEEQPAYKETIEHKGDNQVSDKLIALSDEELKDANSLLKAHNYDPSQWELMNSKSSMWHHSNKEYGTKTLYASKITVKPKNGGFNFDELLDAAQKVSSIKIPKIKTNDNGKYLLLSLFDMHFGIMTFKDYEPNYNRIIHKLDNKYDEVLLVCGQDMFHSDSIYHTRTANGTELEQVDMVKAWNDAVTFYEGIITRSLDKGSDVSVMYSRGNHAESIEWAFVQRLKARFPFLSINDGLKDRKVHMLGNNFCGVAHGDNKAEKNLPENFATEFPIEWSKATTRTVFTGHKHHETVIDKGGVLIRRMPTAVKTDNYHDIKGYTTAHKRFQLHEFSEDMQEASYYV